jgi:hypothetical protein
MMKTSLVLFLTAALGLWLAGVAIAADPKDVTRSDVRYQEVARLWGAQLRAIERMQYEWEIQTYEGDRLQNKFYRARESRNGDRRYRTALLITQNPTGDTSSFAGESAWDGNVSTARTSPASDVVRVQSGRDLLRQAGADSPFDFIGATATLMGIASSLSEPGPTMQISDITTRAPKKDLVEIQWTHQNGVTKCTFDLTKGGWPVHHSFASATGDVSMESLISDFAELESGGNRIFVPTRMESKHPMRLPDRSIRTFRTVYSIKRDVLAINEHVNWTPPFRIEPDAGGKVWDQRLPESDPRQLIADPQGKGELSWSAAERDRINAEYRRRNPTTTPSAVAASTPRSTAVSEPSQWFWLIPLGAGILLVGLGIAFRMRRTAA